MSYMFVKELLNICDMLFVINSVEFYYRRLFLSLFIESFVLKLIVDERKIN